ncbi:MAG: hypothetical protein R3F59_10155 [Myxococcota bacterium]
MAAGFEGSLGAQPLPALASGLGWAGAAPIGWAVALVAAAGAVTTRAGSPRSAGIRALAGLLLTVLLAGPAWAVRPWVVLGVVPLAGALTLLDAARRAAGGDRVALVAAALALLGGAARGWPGLPARTVDAVQLGVLLAGAFVYVATRSVRAAEPARGAA